MNRPFAKTRPRRQKKADTLLHGRTSADDVACDYALGPFDRKVRAMDRKWGVDRLPELVSVETAQRFGKAMAYLNDAIWDIDPTKAADAAANCIRGLEAMDAEAEVLNSPKADPTVWEYDFEGFKFGIMADDRAWPEIKAHRPDLLLFTMREVALALKSAKFAEGGVMEIKKHFPGAQVTEIKPLPKEFWANGGDDLEDFF